MNRDQVAIALITIFSHAHFKFGDDIADWEFGAFEATDGGWCVSMSHRYKSPEHYFDSLSEATLVIDEQAA